MLDRRWRKGVEQGLGPIGDRLRRLGITADALRSSASLCSVATAVLIASGHFVWAVVGVDRRRRQRPARRLRSPGAAARRARAARSSTRSPTAPPTRCCSAASPGTSRADSPYLPILAFAVAACSMLISYERARAESLGLDARGGLMERAERFVLLGIALAFPILVPMLWIMLVLTAFTAIQRFVRVYRLAGRPPRAGARRDPRVERTGRPRCARGGRPGGSSGSDPVAPPLRTARRPAVTRSCPEYEDS